MLDGSALAGSVGHEKVAWSALYKLAILALYANFRQLLGLPTYMDSGFRISKTSRVNLALMLSTRKPAGMATVEGKLSGP